MAFKDDLAELERGLATASVSVGAVLDEAGVVRSTWTRWKNGSCQPRLQVWTSVQDAAGRLIAERSTRAGAAKQGEAA